ncbi:MAG: hypothetical protein IKX79_04545, partial [Desulfovibrionaceae bacterium]|nr:hypothetical protein [Desulfovibrionaceae bacterium]
GAVLCGQCRAMDLPGQFSSLAHAALCLISEDWPRPLAEMLGLFRSRGDAFPAQAGKKKHAGAPHALSMTPKTEAAGRDPDDAPALTPEERRAFDFTLKKILLREVAPQWAPCFD